MINSIESAMKDNGVTMCDFPYEIDGVLKDQASYYLDQYDEIYQAVGAKSK